LEIGAQVFVNEIEERRKVGKSDFPGLGFGTVGDALQESLDKVNREFLQLQGAVVRKKGVITDS
jgi:hypothetical protein